MKNSFFNFIKITLGLVAVLTFSIAPAQAAGVMINQLTDQASASATNAPNPEYAYGSWQAHTWNSWGLGVNEATPEGGLTFLKDGTGGLLNLNLSSSTAITIDVKTLVWGAPEVANTATGFNVNFFSGTDTTHGTSLAYNLASASVPVATTLSVDISAGTMAYGSTSLVDWANITHYEIQGNYANTSPLGLQFTNLQATIPEPNTWVLVGVAGVALLGVRRWRARRES
ncbi:MAG: PEP-CTERM sorting domain-containing protein [Verrucomicrobia bacterium]|nr:PEP-CTERM sorting domain-containing protein [Verrucomicrobiota bacterium]